jgi:hypothetical protein
MNPDFAELSYRIFPTPINTKLKCPGHGGVVQWLSLLPQEQKIHVQIPTWNKVLGENVAMLLCKIVFICIVCLIFT